MADYKNKFKEPREQIEKSEEETQPVEIQTNQKQPETKLKINKQYKVVLVSTNFIIIEVDGFNRSVQGSFPDKKSGDLIEIAL